MNGKEMIPRGLDKNAPADSSEETVPPDGRPATAQPRWWQDFPIDWGRDEYVSRRELTKFAVLTSAAFAVGQLVVAVRGSLKRSAPPPVGKVVASVNEIPIGGAKTFIYPEGSTPRLLVRRGENDFVAYDQACTHLLCPVVPKVDQGQLHCPCHNGFFDLETGDVISGPPRRPLPKVLVEVRDGQVFATGMKQAGT